MQIHARTKTHPEILLLYSVMKSDFLGRADTAILFSKIEAPRKQARHVLFAGHCKICFIALASLL